MARCRSSVPRPPPAEPIRDVGRAHRAHLGVAPQLAGALDGSVGLGAGIAWRR
jgi:hypothetical protein